jgi:uncharacterized membrane protein YqhA
VEIPDMFNTLLKARYLFIIAVFFLLLNSVTFLVVGAVKTVHGYMEFAELGFKSTEDSKPGLYILGGFDSFLISMIFLIVGLAIARIFIFDKIETDQLPDWLNVHTIKDLKVLLWETILVTLVVLCITQVVRHPPDSWNELVYPLFILILSLALYLKKLGE